MGNGEMSFWEAVDEIRDEDRRYRREAYGFVMAALGATAQRLPEERRSDPARRHLSGQELLGGVVRLARAEFGVLAPTVFREWGIHAGEDVGRIVFQLVSRGQLSARPEDSIEDFRQVGDLLAVVSENLDFGPPRRPDPSPGGVSRREPGTAP
jgi:uncharacterized repeat protein (TIGR04138 family)